MIAGDDESTYSLRNNYEACLTPDAQLGPSEYPDYSNENGHLAFHSIKRLHAQSFLLLRVEKSLAEFRSTNSNRLVQVKNPAMLEKPFDGLHKVRYIRRAGTPANRYYRARMRISIAQTQTCFLLVWYSLESEKSLAVSTSPTRINTVR